MVCCTSRSASEPSSATRVRLTTHLGPVAQPREDGLLKAENVLGRCPQLGEMADGHACRCRPPDVACTEPQRFRRAERMSAVGRPRGRSTAAAGNLQRLDYRCCHITLTSDQSNLSWSYNNTCARSVAGELSGRGMASTGWNPPYNNDVKKYLSATNAEVTSDATFNNTGFCWPVTTYNTYKNINVFGGHRGACTTTERASFPTRGRVHLCTSIPNCKEPRENDGWGDPVWTGSPRHPARASQVGARANGREATVG